MHILQFFLKIKFFNFCLLFDRTVVKQETKLERERGDGIGKGPRAGTRNGMPEVQLHYMLHAAHEAIGAFAYL